MLIKTLKIIKQINLKKYLLKNNNKKMIINTRNNKYNNYNSINRTHKII